MAKKIGIVGFYRNDMFGVHTDYLHFVEQFGTPVIIPQTSLEEFNSKFRDIEGLVLPGGADINPERYADNPVALFVLQKWYCYPPDRTQEHFDTKILPSLVRNSLPIFGICRGLQNLNVHFGGSLKNLYNHPTSLKKNDLVNEIIYRDGSRAKVNSFHHQAVARLGTGLEVIARSTDGVVEAIMHSRYPIFAVEYHPERFEDSWSNLVCKTLFA